MSGTMIQRDTFGKTSDGQTVDRYTLRNKRGSQVKIITFGATVTELWMPDREGRLADIVLGFDKIGPYETQSPYFGCMAGRVAFRIAGGEFELEGMKHQLTRNDGQQHLHGGTRGFSRVVWSAEAISRPMPAVRLTYRSPNGDQGYPGALDTEVVYSLSEENELKIDCTATTDRPTLVNLTHHSYFNLAGAGHGDVLKHVLQLEADRWIRAGSPDYPTEVADVSGTPFDFRKPAMIEARLRETGSTPKGYDLCYLHNHADRGLARVAAVVEPGSGRALDVSTTEPAIVLYTGNYLDGTLKGKDGAVYERYGGLCLETGRPPDAIHHPTFPPIVLRPGGQYRHRCVYRFYIS